MLATQAEFARAAEVSRKTITVWKSRGSLVLQGDMIDVEKTVAHLRHHKRHGSAIADKVTAALARGVTGNAAPVTLAADGVTSDAVVTSADAPCPAFLVHLQDEEHDWDRGALAMGVAIGHRMGGVTALAAYDAGLPIEAAKKLETQMTVSTFEVVGQVLSGLGVPLPPGVTDWGEAAMIQRDDLLGVNWAVVEAKAA